ncbi:hypothetical protein FKW77_006532 [Venturia effusa]|uniref:Probable beta-glucosidase G n=1 Tax=Venturia effusa TaxID=50376 RepID=A0A517KWM3_9PEZI|nr:hypothetical protein FKW77_006532 [Venturia effusa]
MVGWYGIGTLSQNISWAAAGDKADAFIAQLNMTEKINMVTGSSSLVCEGYIEPIERLGFQGLCLMDGPAAVHFADSVSVFPSGMTTAASWDKDLILARGQALGAEFRGKGFPIALVAVAGPIGKHPLGGRNWEGSGPDPYLVGIASQLTVEGVQQNGVQATIKHYIGNEQETQRMPGNGSESISSNIDDRTMHELYLWPFANAVKAGSATVMCSYNRVNNTYACENENLLNNILKKELGFQGYVMSDWFATHSTAPSINAGLDMNMPGPLDVASSVFGGLTPNATGPSPTYFGSNITTAIDQGLVNTTRLDEMIHRILTPYFYLGQDQDFPTIDPSTPYAFVNVIGYTPRQLGLPESNVQPRDVRGNHSALIRELGAAGTVLLKNTNNALPLKNISYIGVFGSDASDPTQGSAGGLLLPQAEKVIGTLFIGGGSGSGRATSLVSPLQAIRDQALADGARIQYILDNDVITQVYPTPDVCLVFLSTFASEGLDRDSFELDWNSTTVVETVAGYCPNTVVVTHSAGVNTMPWAENPNVTAILAAHYPGQETGLSIVDILYGRVNPSGHLPYTIPRNESDYDNPVIMAPNADGQWEDNYSEQQLVDYRMFDAKNITPLYEFGYGLSYTTFAMDGDLTISKANASIEAQPSQPIAPGGHADLWETVLTVTTSVSNTGTVAGATVPQLYLSFPAATDSPPKVLRGFEKVNLEPGETQTVTFPLMRRDVSNWNVVEQQWEIPAGEMMILVGFSSRDLPLSGAVTLL